MSGRGIVEKDGWEEKSGEMSGENIAMYDSLRDF